MLFLHSPSGMTPPAPYYRAEENDERPFICSLPSDNGIMSCSDVPARREGGRTCCLDREDALHRQALGLSPEPLANGSGAGEAVGLCINWNQYYTRCHTGNSNPHKDAINFDNIVYAWIVIFQVCFIWVWWWGACLLIWSIKIHTLVRLNSKVINNNTNTNNTAFNANIYRLYFSYILEAMQLTKVI